MVCHRRAGKTVASVNELLIRALRTQKKDARFFYVAPFRSQAKNIAWLYLKEAARPFTNSEKDIRESDLTVRLINGAWIVLAGSDNVDSLRGIYSDGIVVDEYADCKPGLYEEVLLPTMADRQGWIVFIGTSRGKANAFYRTNELAKLDPHWYQMTLKASMSGIIPPKELALMKTQMEDAQYQQELECSFSAPVLGTYYASIIEQLELNGQIAKRPLYDPEFPVHVAADLGYTDSCSWWFWQQRPDGLAIIDFYENDSVPLQEYLDMLDSKGYKYENIFMPHDAKQKTLQTGKSTIEQLLEHYKNTGVNVRLAPNLKVQGGIDAVRLVLNQCHFDSNTTGLGIEHLRAYRRAWDDVNKCFADKPKHDFSSHGADAFRYLALSARNHLKLPTPDIDPLKKVETPLIRDVNSFTLDQLFKDNEHKSSRLEKLRI